MINPISTAFSSEKEKRSSERYTIAMRFVSTIQLKSHRGIGLIDVLWIKEQGLPRSKPILEQPNRLFRAQGNSEDMRIPAVLRFTNAEVLCNS